MKVYLGLDTSCYTTSCALVSESGELIGEARKLLDVKPGARGLQQSQMVFQHTRALPSLIEQLPQDYTLAGIGVSAFPRREANSYMPAFLVGHGLARSLSHIHQVPLYEFSHQENHILAALRVLQTVPAEPFYSLHVSGGTTELLYCEPNEDHFFTAELVNGAIDLHGGQFVDRIGVALGLPFPAGPKLEQLAKGLCRDSASLLQTVKQLVKEESFIPLPVAVKQGALSFGGPCSEAMRRLARLTTKNEEDLKSHDKAMIDPMVSPYTLETQQTMALAVFHCICQSLCKMLTYEWQQRPANRLIAVGGVMANSYLREALLAFGEKQGVTVQFAPPEYSSDNATGVAYGASLLGK
ncbi:metallohydrolase [Veillonella criceti]|uniref:N(6)-L-threonylcarbamoyladenine synthase n=1 Tax=Veillonella criceti TaxID=103891 RepID=A0A380NHI0_9FIRM|nr:metallohydrolase [Veillonella criceti]SUP40867.1 t(6)A37 threonylcarbamoyladenosine biosynthesis protein [Veillonella criceti]